jgi:hypothetical protein
MSTTLLWQGFDYGWIATSHALDRIAAMVDAIVPEDGGGVAARYTTRFGFGNAADAADADVCVCSLSSPVVHVQHGVASTRLAGRGGEPSRVVGPLERVLLPVESTLPDGAELDAACVLRGFSLETEGTARPTRGFGFRLIEPVLDGRLFTFRPEYSFRPADGADYDFTASLAYSVIAAERGQVRLTEATHESTAHSPHESQLLRCVIEGDANSFRFGSVALRGFDWEITDGSACRMRRLSLALDDLRYLPTSGRLSYAANLCFSNKTPGAPAFGVRYRLDETLVQWTQGRAPVETRVRNELGLASGQSSIYFSIGKSRAA